MKRFLITFILIVILTACAPARAIPTVTPIPPAFTPTLKETMTPLATLTSTPDPIVTEPSLTAIMDGSWEKVGLPKGISSIDEAIRYGWTFNNDSQSWRQHIVRNADGDIVFGDLVMQLVEAKYEEHSFMYDFPLINEEQLFPSINFTTSIMPAPTFHYIAMSFLVKNPGVLDTTSFVVGKDEAQFEVWSTTTLDKPIAAWGVTHEDQGLSFSIMTSDKNENSTVAGMAITILVPKEYPLDQIKLSRPGYLPMVIYETEQETVSTLKTPFPTATSVPPTVTFIPDKLMEKVKLPEGYSSINTAIRNGWVFDKGKQAWQQHIVRNAEGDIILGDLKLQLVDANYHDEVQVKYIFPQVDENYSFPALNHKVNKQEDDPSRLFITGFLVKNPATLNAHPLASAGKDVKFEIRFKGRNAIADENEVILLNTLSTDILEYPEKGGLVLDFIVINPENIIESIKLGKPGYPMMVVYDAEE